MVYLLHSFFQLVRVETIPLGTYIMSARLLIKPEEPHPRQSYALSPLPSSGEGIKGSQRGLLPRGDAKGDGGFPHERLACGVQ